MAKSLLSSLAKDTEPDDEAIVIMGEEEEDPIDTAALKMSAAKSLVAAVKAGDIEAADAAMTDHYMACMEEHA